MEKAVFFYKKLVFVCSFYMIWYRIYFLHVIQALLQELVT